MILFHGSFEQVAQPELGKCRPFNDYGPGFYCTLDEDLANEWACKRPGANGWCNRYRLDESGLKILDLEAVPHGALSWMAVLMRNRPFDRAANERVVNAFIGKFAVDLSGADVVTGLRADDSYFSIARAFAAGTITDQQVERALRLGDLGRQVVLRSQAAFDALAFVGVRQVDGSIWHGKWFERDAGARGTFRLIIDEPDPGGRRIFDLAKE